MYDILIIGSGPAGLSAAVYAKRANLKVAVIEKEYEGTGQIAESQQVDNYLGLPGISGYDLGENFRRHAVDAGVEFVEQKITKIRRVSACDEDGASIPVWQLLGEEEYREFAKTVIYAAGAVPRSLQVKGEDRFLGKGISFCAICDGAFYKGKDVAVIGGGDTALDEALYLSDIARTVYLIHRRSEFRGAASTHKLLKQQQNIVFLLDTQVKEVLGTEKLFGLRIQKSDGNEKEIAVDGVFEAIGSDPATELVCDYVKINSQGYIVAGEDGITSAPGLFVAGDVREKNLRQVVTAVADGANAVISATEYLRSLQEFSPIQDGSVQIS